MLRICFTCGCDAQDVTDLLQMHLTFKQVRLDQFEWALHLHITKPESLIYVCEHMDFHDQVWRVYTLCSTGNIHSENEILHAQNYTRVKYSAIHIEL